MQIFTHPSLFVFSSLVCKSVSRVVSAVFGEEKIPTMITLLEINIQFIMKFGSI